MVTPELQRVGTIGTAHLAELLRRQGREDLPYPFAGRPAGTAFATAGGSDRQAMLHWADAYVGADLWVTSREHPRAAGVTGRRVLAYRTGDTGYVARQHDTDAIEVFRLRAVDLAAGVSATIGLTGPGARPAVTVPGYVGYFAPGGSGPSADEDDDAMHTIRVAVASAGTSFAEIPTEVPDAAVAAVTTIQSRWRPPRRWGVDWSKTVLAVLRLDGDGDYAYVSDVGHAVPVTTAAVTGRIEDLIAEDQAAVRRERGTADS